DHCPEASHAPTVDDDSYDEQRGRGPGTVRRGPGTPDFGLVSCIRPDVGTCIGPPFPHGATRARGTDEPVARNAAANAIRRPRSGSEPANGQLSVPAPTPLDAGPAALGPGERPGAGETRARRSDPTPS